MKLSEKIIKEIQALQAEYPEKKSALIPSLHLAQSEHGYLPREIQAQVADLFEIQPSEVAAVVAFYDMFFEKPVGKHIIHVCKNVSCMLNGADCLLKKVREMTSEEEFTVIPSECLAACDRAPMMLIDDKVVGPVKEDDLRRILDEAKNG